MIIGICVPLSESKTQRGSYTDEDERSDGATKEQSYPAIELPFRLLLCRDIVRTEHEQFFKDEWDCQGESKGPAEDGADSEIQDSGKRPLAILVAGWYESMRQRKHRGVHRKGRGKEG